MWPWTEFFQKLKQRQQALSTNAGAKNGNESKSSKVLKNFSTKKKKPSSETSSSSLPEEFSPEEKQSYGLREYPFAKHFPSPKDLEQQSMFTKLTINLTGPICICDKEDLSWGICLEASGQVGMDLECNFCHTILKVPYKKFLASFKLDNPYPHDLASNKNKEEAQQKKKKEDQKKVPTAFGAENKIISIQPKLDEKKKQQQENPLT